MPMKTIQISKSMLQSLYGGSTESMVTVFSEFLNCHSAIRENLVSSYNSGSIDSLKKLLHYHGPTFMYLGMPVISNCFKNLEERCKQGSDRSSISTGFFVLIQFVDQSKQMIMKELECLKGAAC
jgi:hypothetical protein